MTKPPLMHLVYSNNSYFPFSTLKSHPDILNDSRVQFAHLFSFPRSSPWEKKIAKEKRIILQYSLAKAAKNRQSVTVCSCC